MFDNLRAEARASTSRQESIQFDETRARDVRNFIAKRLQGRDIIVTKKFYASLSEVGKSLEENLRSKWKRRFITDVWKGTRAALFGDTRDMIEEKSNLSRKLQGVNIQLRKYGINFRRNEVFIKTSESTHRQMRADQMANVIKTFQNNFIG